MKFSNNGSRCRNIYHHHLTKYDKDFVHLDKIMPILHHTFQIHTQLHILISVIILTISNTNEKRMGIRVLIFT